MSKHPTKPKPTDKSGDEVYEFLVSELPPGMRKEARYFANALREANARYDRYAPIKNEWFQYKARRKRLEGITEFAKGLASRLCELDILSREDLENRVNPKEFNALIGSLYLVGKVTTDLAKDVQKIGKPRDLAEERWILELADIYENAFAEPAKVSGSGADPTKRHGKFYRLLETNRPTKFPRHGKLTLRQIDRTLKRRGAGKHGIELVFLRSDAGPVGS
jgi:hypothetical protein